MQHQYEHVMPNLTDEELYIIVATERNKHEMSAVASAEAELKTRGLWNQDLEALILETQEERTRDPNNVQLRQLPASTFTRFLNFLIDLALIRLVLIPYVLDPLLIQLNLASFLISHPILTTIRGILILIPYYILMEYFLQKTIGKFFTGTQVVTTEWRKPDFSTVVRRSLIRIIPIVDAISFVNKGSGFHDKWTATMVIKDHS